MAKDHTTQALPSSAFRHPSSEAAGRARSDLRIAETTAEAVAKSLAPDHRGDVLLSQAEVREIYILTASGERGLEGLNAGA